MGPQRKVDIKKILDLKAQGLSLAAIKRRLGHDQRTIRRVLDMNLKEK